MSSNQNNGSNSPTGNNNNNTPNPNNNSNNNNNPNPNPNPNLDASGHVITRDNSGNIVTYDLSGNLIQYDASGNVIKYYFTNTKVANNDDFKTLTLNQTINEKGDVITNQQGVTEVGNEKTETIFKPIDISNNMANINEDLLGVVTAGYNDETPNSEVSNLVNQITDLAGKIKCDSFHGKGSIDDYNGLFAAAAKIANESKQMQLDVDIDGFENFGSAADDLASLFVNFTKKLENVNIINDSVFLRAVASALTKIYNLSQVFGRFKETILATSTVKIPKSAHDTSVLLQGVIGEVSCAMNYISNFVNPDPTLTQAQLSTTDKGIIASAAATIDNWNVLCDQGVSIALSNSPDIQFIKSANTNLKNQTTLLQSATNALRAKIAALNN